MLVLLAFLFGAGLAPALVPPARPGLPNKMARRQMQGRIDELDAPARLAEELASTDLVKGDVTGMAPVLDRVIGQTNRGLSLTK